jgi:hypothetical protein
MTSRSVSEDDYDELESGHGEEKFIFMTVDKGAIEREIDVLSCFVDEMQSTFQNPSTRTSHEMHCIIVK